MVARGGAHITIPESEALAWLRMQRHSFLNHLQVIGGWLQLKQADRAAAYVAKVADTMAAEREALAAVPPALSVALLTVFLHAELHGVNATIQVAEPPSDHAAEQVRAFLMASIAAAQTLPIDGGGFEATLTAERLTVVFPVPVLLADAKRPAAEHELSWS